MVANSVYLLNDQSQEYHLVMISAVYAGALATCQAATSTTFCSTASMRQAQPMLVYAHLATARNTLSSKACILSLASATSASKALCAGSDKSSGYA